MESLKNDNRTCIASWRSALISPRSMRVRMFSMIAGLARPLTNTLLFISHVHWRRSQERQALHISQSWKLVFILLVQRGQLLLLVVGSLLQLSLLSTTLLAFDLVLA